MSFSLFLNFSTNTTVFITKKANSIHNNYQDTKMSSQNQQQENNKLLLNTFELNVQKLAGRIGELQFEKNKISTNDFEPKKDKINIQDWKNKRDKNLFIVFNLKYFLSKPFNSQKWTEDLSNKAYERMTRFIRNKSLRQCKAYREFLTLKYSNEFPDFFTFILNEAENMKNNDRTIQALLEKVNEKLEQIKRHMRILAISKKNILIVQEKIQKLIIKF